jgi:hypothetical protein
MSLPTNPHEEPGLLPLEFARLQDELLKSKEDLAAANAANGNSNGAWRNVHANYSPCYAYQTISPLPSN